MFGFIKNLFSGGPFALHITDSYIQAVQISVDEKAPKINSSGQRQLAEGIVKNGIVVSEKQLAQEIKMLLAECKPEPIKNTVCWLALPEQQIYEYIFYLPVQLKEDEFEKNLEELISKTIPIPFEEVVYDYHVSVLYDIKTIFVAAVRRSVRDQYLRLLQNFCHLNPVCFEPESLSLLRNIPQNFPSDQGVFLFDIKDQKIFWFLLLGKDIFESEIMPMAGLTSDPNSLIQELQKASKAFTEKANKTVSSIIISGDPAQAVLLQGNLQTTFKMPITISDRYKVGDEQSKTVCGIGLKTIGIDDGAKINFLKK